MGKGAQILGAATLVVGLLGWLAWSSTEEGAFRYYQTLDEFRSEGNVGIPSRVHGYVALGSIERDVPALGLRLPAPALRRFWMMLAHYHGQVWNASEFARSFGVAHTTVQRYLDVLTETFMVRQLQPWHENIGKRQVRSPKVFVRDSGLLHALLGLSDARAIEEARHAVQAAILGAEICERIVPNYPRYVDTSLNPNGGAPQTTEGLLPEFSVAGTNGTTFTFCTGHRLPFMTALLIFDRDRKLAGFFWRKLDELPRRALQDGTALQEGFLDAERLRVRGPFYIFSRHEPLPADSPLWDFENAILTPHISGGTEIYSQRATAIFARNLTRYLAATPLENLVDPKRGY